MLAQSIIDLFKHHKINLYEDQKKALQARLKGRAVLDNGMKEIVMGDGKTMVTSGHFEKRRMTFVAFAEGRGSGVVGEVMSMDHDQQRPDVRLCFTNPGSIHSVMVNLQRAKDALRSEEWPPVSVDGDTIEDIQLIGDPMDGQWDDRPGIVVGSVAPQADEAAEEEAEDLSEAEAIDVLMRKRQARIKAKAKPKKK